MLDESLKQKLWEAEDEIASWAEEISNSIFMHPELGDQEFFSSEYLTGEIAKLGFEVEFPYMGIPTAFRCELGDGDGPAVCFWQSMMRFPDMALATTHRTCLRT